MAVPRLLHLLFHLGREAIGMLFITEYEKNGHRYAGCNIEAESFEAAHRVAALLSALNVQTGDPTQIKVLGEFVSETQLDEFAHKVTEYICPCCKTKAVSVHPAQLEFIECSCGEWISILDL
jgi:hypothetical protein